MLRKILNIKTPHCAGFTLTELMAVVIIVAILAAVGAGSYKKAVERSHFSEGLTAAHTVLSGVERYYAESCNEGTCERRPNIADLDVALSNPKACSAASDHCVKTKYFEITVNSSGSVTAKRISQNYSIQVYPETMGQFTADRCMGDEDFCRSLGYITCTGTGTASSCQK